jgi:hypothetical protein
MKKKRKQIRMTKAEKFFNDHYFVCKFVSRSGSTCYGKIHFWNEQSNFPTSLEDIDHMSCSGACGFKAVIRKVCHCNDKYNSD